MQPIGDQPAVEDANEGVIEFFLAEIGRAHRLIADHYPRGDGYCHHQGTFRRPVRWPCRLYVLACQAVVRYSAWQRISIPQQRSQPPAGK